MGLVALQHVGSSQTRGLAHVSCIGRSGKFFTTEPPEKPKHILNYCILSNKTLFAEGTLAWISIIGGYLYKSPDKLDLKF